MPPVIEQKIRKRIGWQRPKAMVTGILFLLFAALSVKNWKAMIRRTSAGKSLWQPQGIGLLAGKVTVLPLAFLMMVMFIANTAGSLAPVSISLLGGS
jgi:menaquinone-dependent protoporphyrinogen IX oxidase